MKRTQNINLATFRKSWRSSRITPIAFAISAAFMLSACEKSDDNVSLYQNADDCSKANPSTSAQCAKAFNDAKAEAAKTAPKYANRADCVAEFGESQCTQAPAQAGMSAESQQGGGSMWMPLMAGFMMGRMMSGGGYAQQPLFTSKTAGSPANGKFVDATGKSYGPATTGRSMNVPPSAMAPKPATTSTVTRGGFGESVAKQTSMQRSAASSTRTPMRSMGG
ncbi:hypothetical protein BS639_22875 [Rouxiella silvae]|uniref:UPF0441 protein BS639_22875 n=1 Tax=Rouxiella silvae TaxID=1646373 RepID=A0AA40X0E0_9GAMM|nr:DUF1190 family protein [Rouxiella silvae]KQN43745.1 hypothetical protein ASE93_18445 [Serratia sp. Leaf50]MBF6636159.1 DUF1190 family protein [Rouxiella silvae]ORJ18890.1 hypothetical protein BS639_22875 [Rouxiella silvae]